MQKIRTVLFNIIFFIGSAVFLILSLWILIAPRELVNRYLKGYFRFVFFLADKILGLKVEVQGEHRIRKLEKKKGCFLVISKHQSALETFYYPRLFKEYPVFVHKKELLLIPVWGWYMAKMQMIAIDRSSGRKAIDKMVRKARETYKQGRPIIVFPEGTRTLSGEHNKYKTGFYSIYKDLDVPILPIAINSGSYWNKREFVKKSGTVTIQVLPEIKSGMDKKELMQKLEKDIEGACKKLA